VNTFAPKEDRDILITFRSPNPLSYEAKGKKVWFSCDQHTIGDYKDFATKVDQIVTISKFHSEYFYATYGIQHTTTIDLPVRTWDYAEPIEKIPKRMIFCSVPDRGLEIMTRAYAQILERVPDASLVITSDYRLWGAPSPLNERYVAKFLGVPNVIFRGAIPRRELIKEQLQAQIHAYPCIYAELFCYAVAECQSAGAYPITSNIAALDTTNMGTKIEGDVHSPQWMTNFVDAVVSQLENEHLNELQEQNRADALARFSLERIIREWEEKVFQS
jgi:glycosyltransferase involved in cell wall biosynthesis